jgi:hypothetical protein
MCDQPTELRAAALDQHRIVRRRAAHHIAQARGCFRRATQEVAANATAAPGEALCLQVDVLTDRSALRGS